MKQEKKKNEAEEMIKNKRTVFVGNLPVDCTAQVREWSLSAKGTKDYDSPYFKGTFPLGISHMLMTKISYCESGK